MKLISLVAMDSRTADPDEALMAETPMLASMDSPTVDAQGFPSGGSVDSRQGRRWNFCILW